MKYGARNQLTSKVLEIKKGALMGQIKLEVCTPVQMASVMTLDSMDDLNLKVGDEVKVVVKAIHVLLVKEE